MWSFWAILDSLTTVQTRNGKLTTKLSFLALYKLTRETIHEYSLSFEEAFKGLATFKIIFRYKKHQKAFLTISIYFRPSRIEVYLEVRKNEIHIIFDDFNSDYICKIFL